MPPRKYETYLIYGPSLDGGLPFGPGSNKYSRVCRNSTNRIRYSSAIEIEANELRKLDETSKELKKEEERFIFHIRELNQYLSRADCKVGLQGFTDVDHIVGFWQPFDVIRSFFAHMLDFSRYQLGYLLLVTSSPKS